MATLILADIMNLLTFFSKEYNKIEKTGLENNKKIKTNWYNYDGLKLETTFSPWIPFYKINSCIDINSKHPYIKLYSIGLVKNPKNATFFKIKSTVKDNYKSKLILTKKNNKKIVIKDVSINLDENWTKQLPDKQKGIMHETYWISKETMRDAQIGIETIDLRKMKLIIKNTNELLLLLLTINQFVLSESMIYNGENDSLKYDIYDHNSGRITTTYLKLFKKTESLYLLVNFSSYKSVYDNNAKYFHNILKSIKIK
jgi:hypothetical protein